ncbi:mitogen-activated protein kinase kinase kinase 1-like protein [Tanacetum coccineum]
MNARKNIDYQFPQDSVHQLSAPADYRIDGNDLGQIEAIYRSLGLQSVDDFGIDINSWQNSKITSLDFKNTTTENDEEDEDVESEEVVRVVKVSGIKGVRPPVLTTPEVEDVRVRIERTTLLSASCSFSTSNDDDWSSSTTEPPSSVSPNRYGSNVSSNGRFRNIKITNWQRGELLGRGSFGSVYEGICDGGYFIAVKEVSLLDSGELGRQSVVQLEQEIALLSQFEHENIVRYYGTDKDESKLYIFLELVTKGSLLSLYQRYHLQDCQVSSYTRQILHGLKYLHDRSVVHRDVKCANILVDANGSVKLADFGLAKATKFNDVRSCKGTAFWMAPEVVNQKNKGYGLAADIWSLGCTVLEMLTRRIPYSPMECMAALFRIGSGIAPPVPDSLSKEAKDFIFQCFHVNPRDRPTASQLLEHPFVRRPLPLFSEYATSGQSSSRMSSLQAKATSICGLVEVLTGMGFCFLYPFWRYISLDAMRILSCPV